jgi:mannosyl-oligosaccharide glucosidase
MQKFHSREVEFAVTHEHRQHLFVQHGPDVHLDDHHVISNSMHADILSNRFLLNPQLGLQTLKRLYPALRANYEWYRKTQKGGLKHWSGRPVKNKEGYRWRGRTPGHVLPSGLDDYPRADLHVGELHLDLTCWVAAMTSTMQRIAEHLELEDDVLEYQEIHGEIMENIDAMFWSDYHDAYCDLSVNDDDESVFACHKGYVTLFPMMLHLLPADSPRLGKIFDLMYDPDELWSPYGIRSLTKKHKLFGKGENYWRGPIWINMNYMALASLFKYKQLDGPYKDQAATIYTELRNNLIKNLFKEYKRTGYLWEQYSEKDGKGKRSHPFTGWTALIVNIMAELYI